MSKLIIALGLLELGVVYLVNVPVFVETRNPDDISGTFGTNQYQLVFFLFVFVSLLLSIVVYEPSRPIVRVAPLLIVLASVAILLAQYRSLLIVMLIVSIAVAYLLGGSSRAITSVGFAAICFLCAFYFLGTRLPVLKLDQAASSLSSEPGIYVKGRLGVAQSVERLYGDIPSAILVGTGPGTYSSRAWQTFANSNSTSRSNVQGEYAAALVGGVYKTDVSDRYTLPQLQKGAVIQGSHAVSTPYSSYTSLLAEVGVFGALAMVAVYAIALRRSWRTARRLIRERSSLDPRIPLAIATFAGLLTLVCAAVLENWFEVARVTFVVWTLAAVCEKEADQEITGRQVV
jgi:hypothetical protein